MLESVFFHHDLHDDTVTNPLNVPPLYATLYYVFYMLYARVLLFASSPYDISYQTGNEACMGTYPVTTWYVCLKELSISVTRIQVHHMHD